MSFRKIAASAALLVLLSALAPLGCGRKGGEEGEEIKALPDTLESFSQKIAWLIPRSFESLEYQCRTLLRGFQLLLQDSYSVCQVLDDVSHCYA